MPLTGNQRRHLRALGHALEPVVRVGKAGITSSVVAQLDDALEHHELLKVKLAKDHPVPAAEVAAELAERTHAEVAQVIGRTLLIYRARSKDPTITLPRPRVPQQSP